MEQEKLRSNESPARRPRAKKRPVNVDWTDEQTLAGLGHEESTSVLSETENKPGIEGSLNQSAPSTEVNNPESHLENEAASNGRDDSVAEMDHGSGSEFNKRQEEHDASICSADELLNTIDEEIEGLIADIDDSVGGVCTDETKAAEEAEKDVSATLTEGKASDFQESADSEIATIPSVEEIIATMGEDPLAADEELLQPAADFDADLEPAPTEDDLSSAMGEESLLAVEEEVEFADDFEADLEPAPTEDDLSSAMGEESLLAVEEEVESAADFDADLEPAPTEDDLSSAMGEESLLAVEEEVEFADDFDADLEPAPTEDDLSSAMGEESLLAVEEEVEFADDFDADLEPAPTEDDLSSAMGEESLLAVEEEVEFADDFDADLEPAPTEDDLSSAMGEESLLAVEEEVESADDFDADLEPAPTEDDLSSAMEEESLAADEELPQPTADSKVDLEPVPSLEDLISEIDSKMGRTLDPHHREEGDASEQADQESRDQSKYIRFLLDDILMAIPLSSALEVGHRPDITPLPNLPDWILGISNIRGEIVSVLDLKGFFGRSSSGPGQGNRLIIIQNQDLKVGIIVDGIMGIISLDRIETDIQPNPYSGGDISSFVSGVVVSEEKILNILDVDRLLSNPRMTDF